jgi:uncharacterized protein
VPEYLTPGVYVEETSFRAKSIEGVPTSTTGIAGLTRYGPVSHRARVRGIERTIVTWPRLVTSFTEFERAFGGLEEINGNTNYTAHAARAFFNNGGRRLYVSRVFDLNGGDGNPLPVADVDQNFATRSLGAVGQWRARWPGTAGARIRVAVSFTRSKNVVITRDDGNGNQVTDLVGVRPGALVEVGNAQPDPKKLEGDLKVVGRNADGRLGFVDDAGNWSAPVGPGYHVQLSARVQTGDRIDEYAELAVDPNHTRSIFKVLDPFDPADVDALVWLDANPANPTEVAALAIALLDPNSHGLLSGGRDAAPSVDSLQGRVADPDDINRPATGLEALGEIDDVAIVAMPDIVLLGSDDEQKQATDALLGHCERHRYRIAVVDPPAGSSLAEVRKFRSQFDSKYGALYYPWIEVIDPLARPEPGSPPRKLLLPPSGYVAGIYARSDIERGVHKAPANEVMNGMVRFETNVTGDRQAVLNPEGVNALRFFEGRSNRVWGARTMTSDPEWKYVNVRRLFIYLEHSIDKSTQWAVFEPNNEALWANVRQTIEDFLLVTWKTGALLGTKPEEAYFVRCDRTTMTQNDLDNGRLICLIGVAPTYPAEFVIFRIGQWTADSKRN